MIYLSKVLLYLNIFHLLKISCLTFHLKLVFSLRSLLVQRPLIPSIILFFSQHPPKNELGLFSMASISYSLQEKMNSSLCLNYWNLIFSLLQVKVLFYLNSAFMLSLTFSFEKVVNSHSFLPLSRQLWEDLSVASSLKGTPEYIQLSVDVFSCFPYFSEVLSE